MYCVTCGTKVSDDDQYCLNCGRKLESAANAHNEPTEMPAYIPPSQMPIPKPAEKRAQKRKWIPVILAGILLLATVAMLFFPTYGDWSEWEAEAPAVKDGLDVESAQFYSYRTQGRVESTQEDASLGELVETYPSYTEYGQWSDWQTEAVEQTDLRQVEEAQHYRHRTVTTTQGYSQWGEWSGWVELDMLKATASETTQVETETRYEYFVYRYYCNVCGASYGAINLSMMMHAAYESGLSEEQKATISTYLYYNGDGRISEWEALESVRFSYTQNQLVSAGKELSFSTGTYPYSTTKDGVTWYAQSTAPFFTGKFGRYRTRTQEAVKSYSDWIYSEAPVTVDANMEQEQVVRYRYRTREAETVYVYQGWSKWSDWQQEAVTSTDIRQVQTQIMWRWREKRTFLDALLGG